MYKQLLLLDSARVHDITIFMCIIAVCLGGGGGGKGPGSGVLIGHLMFFLLCGICIRSFT